MAARFAALSSSAHISHKQRVSRFLPPSSSLRPHSSHIAIALSPTLSAGSINQKRGVHGKQRKRRGVSASRAGPHPRDTRTTSSGVSASPGRIGARTMRLASPGQRREVSAMAGAPLRERRLVNFARMLMGALGPVHYKCPSCMQCALPTH
ncbi:hypothetical protein C8J57DRAFT_1471578 [Mycena rebaudengoi]|nr:hypothetical protein C8J57DRAFT_1471578 [Mycena rebaudengoi]